MCKCDNLEKLFDLRAEDLMEIKGIKHVKALQILTGIELCKRALKKKNYGASILEPTDLAAWFQMEIGLKDQEHFVAVYLNAKGKIITLNFTKGGIMLSAKGKALENGGLGDTVRVMNTQSKSVVQGTVTGPETVSIVPAGGHP